MLTVKQWLQEYDASHQNRTNKRIHWVCVPAIMFSIIGLLWAIPRPAVFAEFPLLLNWAVIIAGPLLLYYCLLSLRLAFGMTLLLAAMFGLMFLLAQTALSIGYFSIALFVSAWAGQFIGHEIEGKKPSFFKDLQFLLIGPLWIMAFIYRRLGVAY